MKIRKQKQLNFAAGPALVMLTKRRNIYGGYTLNSRNFSYGANLLNKPTENKNSQKLLPFRPIILCLLPLCWIIFNNEQYVITFYNEYVNNIWWLLIPAFVSTLFLYSKNFYLLFAARFLAILQLGWIKVLITEIKKDRDILIDIPEFIRIKRVWSKTELNNKIRQTMIEYNIVPQPEVVSRILAESNNSIVEATMLTEKYITKILNPPVWKTALVFLSQNALPLGLTIISAVITAQIYKWWQGGTANLTHKVLVNSQNTAELARTTSSKIAELDVTTRHHARILDQQSANIAGMETDFNRTIVNRVQPEIRELAAQDVKLSAAVDKLNTTAIGMDVKLQQNENTLLGMSYAITAIKKFIKYS